MAAKVYCAECGRELVEHPLAKILETWQGVYEPCPEHPLACVTETPPVMEVHAKGGDRWLP